MPELNESDKTVRVVICLLLPFFLILTVYYSVEQIPPKDKSKENITLGGLAFSKVLIMVLLCVYILTSCYAFQIELKFCILISIGVLLSSVSDGLSLFQGKIDNAFMYMLLFYGCAHLFYTIPFGFSPLNPIMAVLIGLPFVGILMVTIPQMESPSVYYTLVYTVVTILMEWRIIARVSQHSGPLNPGIIAATIGAACLAISDAVVMYNKYHSGIRFSYIIVPVTYYMGQLGIASSIFHLPHKLRPPNPYLHISGDELCEQICGGCPFS